MAVHRDIGADEPLERPAGLHEHRDAVRSWRLGAGTLACPRCDAPVALAAGPVTPVDPLGCPYCRHAGPVREFLSLEAPSRPAHVDVRIVHRRRPGS